MSRADSLPAFIFAFLVAESAQHECFQIVIGISADLAKSQVADLAVFQNLSGKIG